jgi:VCBS repeat-containing protein
VTICQPGANTTVSSPVQVIAGTTDTRTVTLMQIYLDGKKVYEVKASSLNTSLTMSAGTHRLTVQAYDGSWFKQTINITVH